MKKTTFSVTAIANKYNYVCVLFLINIPGKCGTKIQLECRSLAHTHVTP